MTDFDSTMALLSCDVPDIEIPNYPRPAGGDSDEEEVFFGPHRSDKEKHGKNSIEYLRRVTLKPGEVQPKLASYRGDPNNRSIPEEDEDDKENKTAPTISPNKLNVENGSNINFVLKTPKLSELKSSVDDDDDSRTSFVDADNDQMFDCSIFTEYDDRDLSCMSENISNKWRSRLTKEQSKKLKKSRSEQSQAKVTTLTKEEKKHILIANETLDLLDELNILESDPAVDVDKVKKNLNFDESKRIEEEEVQIPDEILSLPPSQHSDKVKSKPETEDGVASKSEFKEPEIWHQSKNEADDRLNMSMGSTGSRRRSSTNSTCSDWFNTTREEMILYEKFGEDYDLVVEKMSHQEKAKLKEEIANAVPKDVRELLGDQMTNEDEVCDQDRELDDIVEEEENHQTNTSKESHHDSTHHSSSNRSRIPVRDVIKTADLDISKAFAALEAAQSNDLDVTKAFAALEATRVDDNDVSKVFAALEASQLSVHDVSKSSISRVEETPDVSQMSDRILPKRQEQQQQQPTEIKLDENEFQQRRPPIPLPRTLTPQKSREAPTVVDKEIGQAFLLHSVVEKEVKVDKKLSPSEDVPFAIQKETKFDKKAVSTPAQDPLKSASDNETKVDKQMFRSPSKNLASATKKETKVEKRAIFTPAKDLLPPVTEKETKAVEKRIFATPGKETNVDKGDFVAPPPASSDPRPSGGRRRFFKTPEALKTPSYLKPTSASQNRASPRKVDPSSPSASPQLCNRGNYCSASPFMNPWQPSPSSASKQHRGYPAIDMTKIVSPVAQYIHNSNVPKLMRNIRPKVTNNLEQELLAIQEFEAKEKELMEEEEQQSNRQQPKKRYFKPLPEAEYRSSRVALEKEVASEEPKDLPKKFWTTSSTEAVVVRHLARERVGQQEIRNWPSSPDGGRAEQMGGGVVLVRSTAPARESDCFNETSMEMSIREVKKIKKLTSSVSKRCLN